MSADNGPYGDSNAGPWVCECGRRFTSEEESVGHLDPRPAHDGYRFCRGEVLHEAYRQEAHNDAS